MSIRQRLGAFVASAAIRFSGMGSGIVNRYEGGLPNINRASLYRGVSSAKMDMSEMTRSQIMSKARHYEQNSPFVEAVLSAFERYTIHTGINPVASSSSDRFNKVAQEYWDNWCKFCSVDSRLNFYEIQRIIERRATSDGDILTLLVEGESGNPRIQLVESFRCKSDSKAGDNESDGVIMDERGRPIGYRIFEDTKMGVMQRSVTVEADAVVLHYNPTRAGQIRGMSQFAPVMNWIQQLDEILEAELIAVKAQNNVVEVVTNEAGEVTMGDSNDFFTTNKRVVNETDSLASEKDAYYKAVLGPHARYLKRGDKYQQVASNRPSQSWQGYIEYLSRAKCAGIGVSFDTVFEPSKQGGATLRYQLEKDQRFFSQRGQARIREFQRIYEFVIGTAIDRGEIKNAPKDWYKASWQLPKRVTVDMGRESKGMIAELESGIRTLKEIHGEAGKDWKVELEQKAKEMAEAKRLAEVYGLERAEIIKIDPNELSVAAQAAISAEASASADTEDEDDEDEEEDKDE